MKINMALWDRVLRLLLGVLFVAWAVAGGPWWSFIGLYFLATASWQFCPLYALITRRNS